MRSTLNSIVDRLERGDYRNEEHVRVSLVCRVLMQLGWDTWNPKEVNLEFAAVPREDSTRVDVVLFVPPHHKPAVFIEVKSVGKLVAGLGAAEIQARDYNRNNTADISVLTDGQLWRFYLPGAAGEFSQKCFETLDLRGAVEVLDDAELAFDAFLSKDALTTGRAVEEAKTYLKRTDAERVMHEVLPLAKIDVEQAPELSLVDHFLRRCSDRGVHSDGASASRFIRNASGRGGPIVAPLVPVPRNPRHRAGQVPTVVAAQRQHKSAARLGSTHSLVGKRGTSAHGLQLPSGAFRVLRGSVAAPATTGFEGRSRDLAKDLEARGVLVPMASGLLLLKEDDEFSSWSAAASVFLGCSASGPREWKEGQRAPTTGKRAIALLRSLVELDFAPRPSRSVRFRM